MRFHLLTILCDRRLASFSLMKLMLLGPRENNGKDIQRKHCINYLLKWMVLSRMSDVNMLPEETKEAMASLIFAASRIGELMELQYVRSLFVERFGLEFDKDCVDLRRGNVVCSEIVKILDVNLPRDKITDIVMELSQKYQTNTAASADSISEEDSASSNDLGFADSGAVKTEKMKTVVRRKKLMKENSMFLHPNLEESQGRDRSAFMR